MFIDPGTLIDDALDQLETLSAFLSDETDQRVHGPDALTPEARACKEALLTIRVLIPKLQRARLAQLGQLRAGGLRAAPACNNCDS